MRLTNQQRRRPGNVLILFVLFLFVLFAVAALAVDMGFVFLSRQEMQTTVDSAALEGLRKRDDPLVAPADRDTIRRQAAGNMVALVFDDDLQPADGDPNQFGAGPVVQLSGGVGESNALQTVTVSDPPVYKPVLQSNLANEQQGDMVAGQFVGLPATNGPAEDKDYNRIQGDFIPANAAAAASADAFLVRMRRTNDFQGLDDEPGVSSRGPSLPLLFGRGSLIAGADPAAGYSPRHHGITVRATAIAAARRAKTVGTPHPELTPPLPGGTPFVLFQSAWGSLLPTDTPTPITLNGTGMLQVGAVPVGYWISVTPAPPIAVGQVTTPTGADPAVAQLLAAMSSPGYAPITPNDGSAIASSVIGFGYVEIDPASITVTGFLITKRVNRIAPANASVVWNVPANLTDAIVLTNVLNAHRSFSDPLQAPALVR